MNKQQRKSIETILHVESSLFGASGVSTQLSRSLVAKLSGSLEGVELIQRDLSKEPVPHLDAATIQAIAEGKPTIGDTFIAELKRADVIVLAAPMYNFGVPSALKAWFDHIARAGSTFRYTESGPEGLLKGKKVYVVTSRGGYHKGAETDVEVPFIKTFLGFLGLTDVEFIYAEGLNLSGKREQGLAEASTQIDALIEEEMA